MSRWADWLERFTVGWTVCHGRHPTMCLALWAAVSFHVTLALIRLALVFAGVNWDPWLGVIL